MDDDFLRREAERTLDDYSWAWEGEREEVTDHGDAVVRAVAVPWFGLDGMVVRLRFDPALIDERLDAVMAQTGDRPFWWVVGPSARPDDLVERLVARGLAVAVEWDGLVLRNLSTPIPANPDVAIEPLSPDNADDYAAFCAALDPAQDPRVAEERRAAAHRFLSTEPKQALIYVARLDGQFAACAVSRIEPTGVVYLRNAFTLPEFRGRGAYLALVAHRLAVARAAGCTAAVVQAQTRTSSPILTKRGFTRVCGLFGLTRPGV